MGAHVELESQVKVRLVNRSKEEAVVKTGPVEQESFSQNSPLKVYPPVNVAGTTALPKPDAKTGESMAMKS